MHKYDVECECDVCQKAKAIARVMIERAIRNGCEVGLEQKEKLLEAIAEGGKPGQFEFEEWLKGR